MHTCHNDIAELAIDIGEALLINGGEIHRVEDTISRICKSKGAVKTDAFCIIKAIVVTVKFEDGTVFTSSRRIHTTSSNYKRIERLNSLSRELCSGSISVEDARKKLKRIKEGFKCPLQKLIIGYILFAFSCAMFFGGTFFDALMTIPCALFMTAYTLVVGKLGINKTVYNFIASFLCGVIIMTLPLLGAQINAGHVITGSLMLLIPGIALSNSIEDLLMGDTTSGILNICESVLAACAIAAGYALAIKVFGVSDILGAPTEYTWYALLILSLLSAFSYAMVGNASTTLFLCISIGGALSYAIYHFAFLFTANEFGSIFIASALTTLYSRICAIKLKCPTPIFSTPSLIPLAPGNVLYLTIYHALRSDWNNMQFYFLKTLLIASGIALGLMAVMFLWDLISNLIGSAKAVKNKEQNT